MTGNDHTEQTADPLELAEIKGRGQPFLERLPECQTVCIKILAGEMQPHPPECQEHEGAYGDCWLC